MAGAVERRYPSPLRYPGGKGKIANYVKLLLIENDLVGCDYVEPYAGGASVALSLLFEEFASTVHINDLNRSVHAFWRAVLEEADELVARIVDTPVSLDTWEWSRSVQVAADPSLMDLAFSTFFLNRTNRSGIIGGGGVIGGKQQRGPWKLDARYNKRELVRRIRKVARHSSRIKVTGVDAKELLGEFTKKRSETTFLYLDPPYYVKADRLYQNFYKHDDHRDISRLVRRLRCPWVVSYDHAPAIQELYRDLRSIRYGLQYSAADSYEGTELMFFAPGVRSPEVETPAGIPARRVEIATCGAAVGG